MLLGVIADDFTGASDIANTIAKGHGQEGGLKTVQFLGIPTAPVGEEVEAAVISLKSRSIPAVEAVAQSLAALDWLLAQGCRQVIFKYCSTFDSTPQGNIGPVGEVLAQRLDAKGVIACPAFPGAGRTIYKGHLFVGDRLLNESGMEHHPLNPMTDADLRRWLALQCRESVGLVDWSVLRRGPDAIRKALLEGAGRGERLVIVDTLSDEDLLAIGEACAEARLLTGGSGIALGLPRNFIRAGLAKGGRPQVEPVDGPEAILVGSCSRATLSQIDTHAKDHPVLAIDVNAVMSGTVSPQDLLLFLQRNVGRAPLVYSSAVSDQVAALQDRYGRDVMAHKLEGLFAATARLLLESGYRRIVVGGGETSGAVVSALGITSFRIGPEIDPGVPVLVAADGTGVAMALKSGNFGAPDFFGKALRALGGSAREQAMSDEARLRDAIARFGAILYQRGLAHGTAGNISVRLEDGSILVTPTNSCLGFLDPARISRVAPDGTPLAGDPPSKESFFHLAVYEERPSARSVVHLHCTHSVAMSCLCHADPSDVLPPLTAYAVMRVGRLPLVPYYRPGDRALAEAVRGVARDHSAMLLANHGPIVAAKSLEEAVYTSEELEETARLFFLIGDRPSRPLTCEAIEDLNKAFSN